MDQDTEIGSDASGTAVDPHDSASVGTPEGSRTHYRSLEEADIAARRFQSDLDRTKAELEKWKQHLGKWEALGGPEQISRLVGDAVELAGRPDFNDYRSGKLAAAKDEEPDDEYLTDEQREIRDLRRQLEATQTDTRNQKGQVNGELATLRFERAEKEIQAELGEHWNKRRGQVMSEVQRLAAQGYLPNLDAINPAFLHRAWRNSFADPKEFDAVMTKIVLDKEANRTTAINGKSTLPPNTLSPGAPPNAPPKNMKEAWERGLREMRERGEYIPAS